MKKIVLLAISSVVFMSGCATILNDETQRINISSSNNQAIQGNINGINFHGPGVVEVKRSREDAIVYVENEGCHKETLATTSVDPKFFINILSGGSYGSTTDYATGHMWQYESNVVVNCQ